MSAYIVNDATKTYKNNRKEIDRLINLIRDGLKEFDKDQADNPKDWGFAGNTSDIIEKLAHAAYMTGALNENEVGKITGQPF
jgi:hypothetical protein